MTGSLERRLGLTASVAIGASSMIGAGLFVVFSPAVAAAGDGVLVAVAIAALVAACNALSSARLARRHPSAGGTYVYGREILGPFWGYVAGWSFIAGKLASCAAMAQAIGAYVWPGHERLVAVAAIAIVVVINLAGVKKSAAAAIVVVSVVLIVVVTALVTMALGPGAADAPRGTSAGGVLEAAGLLFFAFAGYARLATLGEEVRDPERTIPRAIGIAVVLVVVLYTATILALLHALGAGALADASRPLVAALEAVGADPLVPVVVAAAALAAGGALLSLVLGVSRTTLAMARDGHLPRRLAAVHPRRRVPWVAETAAGVCAAALVLVGDLSSSIAFSSFCVLIYYAIANAAAVTLPADRLLRGSAAAGLAGCVLLATSLPASSVAAGAAVVAAGACVYLLRRPGRGGPDGRPTGRRGTRTP